MKSSSLFRRCYPAAILLTFLPAGETQAGSSFWTGGSADWFNGGSAFNWLPTDEPDPDDSAFFSTADFVRLGSNNSILGLTMSGGIDLDTNGNDLTVDGLVLLSDSSILSDSSTNFIITGATSTVLPDSVTVNSGASVDMRLGFVNMIEETGNGLFTIASGGSLLGRGTVTMNDAVALGTVLMRNDGTISARDSSVVIGTPNTGILRISANDADARIDLDGNSGNGIVNVFRNQTLDLNVAIGDAYSGEMNLYQNAVIDVASSWSIDTGTLDVNSGFSAGFPPIVPNIPASPAFVRGGAFTQTGGTITNIDEDGTLQFDAAFSMNGGDLVNNGTLVFNANATIAAAANLTMPTGTSSITVTSGVEVNVDQANFNPDGTGTVTNILTIGSGGILDLDLGVGADATIDSFIILNGGELDVTTATGSWVINRSVTTGTSTGASQINGNPVTFNGGVSVGTESVLTTNASSTWPGGSSALVAGSLNCVANAILSGGSFTGAGVLLLGSNSTVSANTTVAVNFFDWDGISPGDLQTINDGVTLTINSPVIDSGNPMDDRISLGGNSATLAVNGVSSWVMANTLTANPSALGTAIIGGSASFTLAGTNAKLNVLGNTTISARAIFGASSITTINATRTLRLIGGSVGATNTLAGGAINGLGSLGTNTGKNLIGYGSIAATVDFDGASDLLADDGMLTITGSIVDARNVGSADTDGIFNVVNAWNSASVNTISLIGGEVRGGTITLDNAFGITGIGLVSAKVINNSRISTAGSGTLTVQTAANDNDWDGNTNMGNLTGNFGTLELRDNSSFAFSGTITAQSGGIVFANGFALNPGPTSTINLSNGRFRSTASTSIAGTVVVSAGASSSLEVQASSSLDLLSTANLTLNGDLLLATNSGRIRAGAVFSGGGALIVPVSSFLLLDPGADVDVLVDNSGIILVGGPGLGRCDVGDFQQNAGATLDFSMGGTALTQFDRLVVNGAAQLAGTLNLTLSGGFVPALGQTFNILSATSGVSGIFATVIQPPGMPAGLAFRVNYQPTITQLEVVNTSAYDTWISGFAGLTTPAQRLKSANPDGDSLNNLGEFALDGNPASGANSGKIFGKIAPVSGVNVMTLTLAMRSGATPAAGDPAGGELVLEQTADSVTYAVQATDNLFSFPVDVTEVTGLDATAIQSGLPATNSGWGYRSFRSQGPVAGDPEEFMRVFIHD